MPLTRHDAKVQLDSSKTVEGCLLSADGEVVSRKSLSTVPDNETLPIPH